jgi:hypothetical protein
MVGGVALRPQEGWALSGDRRGTESLSPPPAGMLAPGPELRIPGTAAQTRMVSVAKIRLDSRKSTRPFKGIICDDISEFESHMASHAVGSL